MSAYNHNLSGFCVQMYKKNPLNTIQMPERCIFFASKAGLNWELNSFQLGVR